jgi:hypothetical protein
MSAMMKKVTKAFVLAVIFAIGCYVSYWQGWSTGNSHGYFQGSNNRAESSSIRHHYEFKQNGNSIFRFDLDTGESCWLQLGKADANEEDGLMHPMQQCSR